MYSMGHLSCESSFSSLPLWFTRWMWKRYTRMSEKPIRLMKISWISGFTKMLFTYSSIRSMLSSPMLPAWKIGV